MFFEVISKGFAGANSYILGSGEEAVVIDVGNNADDIYEIAVREGMRIKYIFLTHGHFDHILFLDELQRKTNAKVAIHEADAIALTDPSFNVSDLFGMSKVYKEADIKLKDGDTITTADLTFEIIHTPGHTPGGICIKCNDKLFTGDTLFDGDFGRTDLKYGNAAMLQKSLNRLFQMDGNLMVYPGHDSANKLKNIVAKCKAENMLDNDLWL